MTIELVPITRTRQPYGGVNYGGYRIIVESPDARLVYIYSQSAYINRMVGRMSYPASIAVINNFSEHGRRAQHKDFEQELPQGQRLTHDLLHSVTVRNAVINKWGVAVADALSLKFALKVTP